MTFEDNFGNKNFCINAISKYSTVLVEALDVFKNFQTSIPSSRNLDFLFISIGSDFSKSETVVGQILQSA